MIEMRKRFVSFVDDFENLISLDETYDFFIKSADSIEIGFHKCIFLCRTGYPSELEDIKQKLQNFPSKDLIILRKFLYTTKYKHQDLDSAKLTKIFESIDRKDIINRNTYWHLISDISTLWNHEESKDFTFIVHEKKLNVHKAILIARSDLFKGMFISVNDSSNVVHEYSGKTYPAMKALIHFFYTDVLDCPKKVLKEIDDSARFYQLNRKTMLTFYQNQK
ncbi:hypothetical protein M0811_00429 [Anaeramoeba ignava]|uniref:BTB domain-containing protein n=1 Tax=Anaeramoeba ignava TaxID=1746090 RepID=A0A9Q0REG9_ANAIG|nr:hypothetical protein M0811_00429 [Anaeramoeba ignava]